jgi:hypothetical protein
MDTNGICNGEFFNLCRSMGILLKGGYFAKERVSPVVGSERAGENWYHAGSGLGIIPIRPVKLIG